MKPEYVILSFILIAGLGGGWYLRREAIKLQHRERLKSQEAKRRSFVRVMDCPGSARHFRPMYYGPEYASAALAVWAQRGSIHLDSSA
jgi:hypothetical protein